MCRLLYTKSEAPFTIEFQLEKFARVAKNSKEYQGHGWGCAYLKNGNWQYYKNIKTGMIIWGNLARQECCSLMPAVLLELGPITNPAAESELSTDDGLERLAQAIENGITHYFSTVIRN